MIGWLTGLPLARLRLGLEVALVVALVSTGTIAYVYRAKLQASESQVAEQLAEARRLTAEATVKAMQQRQKQREAQLLRDKELSDQAAKEARERALAAENALTRARRDRKDESKEGGCLVQPLSERTRQRLRNLEADYRAGGNDGVREGAGPE